MTISKAITIIGGKNTGRILVRASDVTIDGTEVTGGNTPLQQGVIDIDNASRVLVRNAYIHDALGSCISLSNVIDGTVEGSTLARCQQQGFHTTGSTRTVYRSNIIRDNNSALAPGPRVDSGWEAGGGKMTYARTALFEGNESFGNGGPGLWCDIDCRDVTFRNNYVHDNTGEGIFFEISDGTLIEGNRVVENGWGSPAWAYGAGILVSASRNAMVRNNVVIDNARGISVLSQNRGNYPVTAPGDSSNQRIENNVIVARNGAGLAGFYQDWAGTLFTAPGVGGSGNRYWSDVSEPSSDGIGRFEWLGHKNTLALYNATPGEEAGTYMTAAEAAAYRE